jgi:iron complex transport system substrate-binding protein
LLGSLLAAVGLSNAAERLGVRFVSQVPLEAIVKLRPDVIVVADERAFASDQGAALLRHPALERDYPRERRIVIPEDLLVCGGPALPQAIRHLAREVSRIRSVLAQHGVR